MLVIELYKAPSSVNLWYCGHERRAGCVTLLPLTDHADSDLLECRECVFDLIVGNHEKFNNKIVPDFEIAGMEYIMQNGSVTEVPFDTTTENQVGL